MSENVSAKVAEGGDKEKERVEMGRKGGGGGGESRVA